MYLVLKLHRNETRSFCDQSLFFSLGASRLVDAASPQVISTLCIDKKKYPLEPRVQYWQLGRKHPSTRTLQVNIFDP